jgi:hypothetical protein
MRLLHTTKLELQQFFDDKIPKYAILSHRWEAEEVSLQGFNAHQTLRRPEIRTLDRLSELVCDDDKSKPGVRQNHKML